MTIAGSGISVGWIVRLVAAILIALAFVGMLAISELQVHQELRVIAPPRVLRGESLPVRALLFDDLQAIGGPRLVAKRVQAVLLDQEGHEVAHMQLHAGLSDTIEGNLSVPTRAPEQLTLSVRASVDDAHVLRVDLPVHLVSRPGATHPPPPRPLRGLQQLSMGSIAVQTMGADAGVASGLEASFSLAVGGGACVPELPCELLAFGRRPIERIQFHGHASAELTAHEEHMMPWPISQAKVTPHGPEALIELDATASSQASAKELPLGRTSTRLRRRVRLPMELGGQRLWSSTRLVSKQSPLQLRLLGNEASACIVDVYATDRWVHTATVAHCEAPFTLPSSLPAGAVRLQIRRDPFSSDKAAVVVVHVQDPKSVDPLADLANAANLYALGDELLQQVIKDVHNRGNTWELAERTRVATLLAVVQETGIFALPSSIGSIASSQAKNSAKKRELRTYAMAALLVACLSLLLSIGHSSAMASEEADEVMRLSGQDEGARRRGRARRGFRLLAALISLLLGFLAMVAYVLVRF